MGGWPRCRPDGVRNYWRRQRTAINPAVEPTGITRRFDGSIEVRVHQVVRDPTGAVLPDREVRHIYAVVDALVEHMDIEE